MTGNQQAHGEGPPIFIVGDGRSGTTLLRMMVSAHPNIYICHESWFYIFDAICHPKYDSETFLHYYFRTKSFRWLRLNTNRVLSGLPTPLFRDELFRVFEQMMKQKAASYGRKRYGDKTPGFAYHLPRLFADFPDAKVIQMVRDPRSEIMSLCDMPFGSSSEVINCRFYQATHKAVMAFENRILRIRLEDLLADPRREMERFLEFVGEPWDDAVLDHANHRADPDDTPDEPWFSQAERPVQSDARPRWESAPAWRVRLIEWLCGSALRDYGYQPSEVAKKASMLSVYLKAATQIPDVLRGIRISVRMASLARHPQNWGTGLRDAQNPALMKLYRRVNPGWWAKNPDYKAPPIPELDESPIAEPVV